MANRRLRIMKTKLTYCPGAGAYLNPVRCIWAAAAVLEAAALTPHQTILEGLEHAGLNQARRSFVLQPEGFSCAARDDGIEISFSLGPGEYATSLLMDGFELHSGSGVDAAGAAQATGSGR